MVAAEVARSASFCASWRSSAAILARCSAVWLIRYWRWLATSAGLAPAGGWKSASGSAPSAKAACSRATSSWAAIRSLCRCSRSAAFIVGSSSISTSPALTVSPSCTWIARTTPVSNGWMTLVRPLGMILPGAVATMSTVPRQAQASASTNTMMIVAPIARPIGEGGVSTISSAAGRKASSWSRRRTRLSGNGTTAFEDCAGSVIARFPGCRPACGAASRSARRCAPARHACRPRRSGRARW